MWDMSRKIHYPFQEKKVLGFTKSAAGIAKQPLRFSANGAAGCQALLLQRSFAQ
jgi:hypothetical protein